MTEPGKQLGDSAEELSSLAGLNIGPDEQIDPASGSGRRKVVTGPKTEPVEAEQIRSGALKVKKLAFYTKLHVCSDGMVPQTDTTLRALTYEDYYVLSDGGDHYHWLDIRTDPRDQNKPKYLPFTIDSSMKLILKANFEVTTEEPLKATPKIAIVNEYFEFNLEEGQTSGEFELEFDVTEESFREYQHHISYFRRFILEFQYSLDEEHTWEYAGRSLNELYITWKEPSLNTFHIEYDSDGGKMRFFYSGTGDLPYVPESLLFIGCHNARGIGDQKPDEKQNRLDVMNALFTDFNNLAVRRRRETFSHEEQMGYWRGHFAEHSLPPGIRHFGPQSGVGWLLQFGEGRCSHWTLLLLSVAFLQGIEVAEDYSIGTDMSLYRLYPIENEHNKRFVTVMRENDTEKQMDLDDNPNAMIYQYGSEEYPHGAVMVKNIKEKEPSVLSNNKFYTCVFLIKNWSIKDPRPPVCATPIRAQGNASPLPFFWDHVFVVLLEPGDQGDIRYFDPSYGTRSVHAYPSDKDLIHAYSEDSMDGVVRVSVTQAVKKNPNMKMYDSVHTGAYVQLFSMYSFDKNHENVDGCEFNTVTTNMEKILLKIS